MSSKRHSNRHYFRCFFPCHPDGECYNTPDGRDYNGRVNLTQSGVQCLPWRDTVFVTTNITINVSALAAEGHNYCRNPSPGEMTAPWCLVEDDDDGARWEYCYVGEPQMRCLQGNEGWRPNGYAMSLGISVNKSSTFTGYGTPSPLWRG